MYKLIGKYGNDIVETSDELKKEKLISLGYTLKADKPKTTKKADKPKK